jgi:SH3 domain protein
MRVVLRGLALSSLAALLAAPLCAGADYIRDEVRVNMRSGPSADYRILRVLSSGEQIARLQKNENWVLVRTADGKEGWVPIAYVTKEIPPSVTLPKVKAQLEEAQAWIEELSTQIASQAEAVKELADLRARNQQLEEENRQYVRSDTWKKWFTGAAIAGIFLAVGGMWPRGGTQRPRRIKL